MHAITKTTPRADNGRYSRPGLVRLVLIGALLCSVAGFIFYARANPVPNLAILLLPAGGFFLFVAALLIAIAATKTRSIE